MYVYSGSMLLTLLFYRMLDFIIGNLLEYVVEH